METHLINAVLTNGARYYVDHAHPELSTPECADARAIVVWDRAAEEIIRESITAANRLLPEGQEVIVHKNNSDGKGNSYGCHENYLMARSVPFGQGGQPRHRPLHLPSALHRQRQDRLGSAGLGIAQVPYQLTQRADFFEAEVGLETTLKRPIINTRDEPHADAHKYRRLHVITGDANRSETATFLKVGTTAFVLAMVEDDALPTTFAFRNPVQAMRQVSYDLALTLPLELVDGSTVTALEVQRELHARACDWAEGHGFDVVGGDAVGKQVLDEWDRVLAGLETDPATVADRVDWVAKHRLLTVYQDRHGLDWGDSKLGALALQYHDMRPERSLADRVGLVRLTEDDEVRQAMTEPPTDTRAYFRGRCLQRWAPAGGGGQLGLDRVRRGPVVAAPGADDGTITWDPQPRRYPVGRERRPRRTPGPTQRLRSIPMAEREQKRKPAPAREAEVVEEAPATSETGEKLKADIDDLLDEIDEVLETNAEDFVRSYVQKGGE